MTTTIRMLLFSSSIDHYCLEVIFFDTCKRSKLHIVLFNKSRYECFARCYQRQLAFITQNYIMYLFARYKCGSKNISYSIRVEIKRIICMCQLSKPKLIIVLDYNSFILNIKDVGEKFCHYHKGCAPIEQTLSSTLYHQIKLELY